MRFWKPGPRKGAPICSSKCSADRSSLWSRQKRTRRYERARTDQNDSTSLPWEVDHRRGDRRLWQEHSAPPAAQMVGVQRIQGVLHGMEFLGTGQSYDQAREEKQEPHPDDVQSAACDRLCE